MKIYSNNKNISTNNNLFILLQILSRIKSDSASSRNSSSPSVKKSIPDFEDFLIQRDYTGARTVLEVKEHLKSLMGLVLHFINSYSFVQWKMATLEV